MLLGLNSVFPTSSPSSGASITKKNGLITALSYTYCLIQTFIGSIGYLLMLEKKL